MDVYGQKSIHFLFILSVCNLISTLSIRWGTTPPCVAWLQIFYIRIFTREPGRIKNVVSFRSITK